MKRTLRYAMLVLFLAGGGCAEDRRDDMELRTFQLERLSSETATALLTPYISDGGTLVARGDLITVRDEPARLDRVAEILARYDGPAQVRVQIYVLEGGDFEGTTTLAFEPTLRELLPYRGYRLLDEAGFGTSEWSRFLRTGGAPFAIHGEVKEVRVEPSGGSATIEVAVEGQAEARLGEVLQSIVNAPFGETVVVASHRGGGQGPTLIVALRADLVENGGGARTVARDSTR